MFIRLLFVALFFGYLPSMVAAIGVNNQDSAPSLCLILESERIQNQILAFGALPQWEDRLAQLDHLVLQKLNSNDLVEEEEHYLKGYYAWRNEDYLEARNQWLKFLAKNKGAEIPIMDPRLWEVQVFFDKAAAVVKMERVVNEPQMSPTPPLPIQPPFEEPIRKEPPAVFHSRLTVNDLISQAGKAKSRGKLEYAWRILQMARQLDPNSSRVLREIENLEKEMN